MQPEFILAQISDLHLKKDGKLAYQQVDTLQSLKNAVAQINAFRPTIDAVFITGDLTDFGGKDDYQQLKAVLDLLEVPYFLISGNHDQRENLRQAFPAQPFPALGELNWVCDDFPIRLIGLDSLVEGKPHGQLTEASLQWLQTTLAALEKPTVIGIHHPPIAVGIKHMDVQPLINADELAQVLTQFNHIERLLCGHIHRHISANWAGTQMLICPGVSHQVALDFSAEPTPAFRMEPPAMLIHSLIDGNLVSHSLPIGDYGGDYPFFDQHGKIID